jgi:hypothetical protein
MAWVQHESNHWLVKKKDNPFIVQERSRLDVFRENFVPIHSYVIDRSRLSGFRLYFDESLPPLENYDFLLRLCASFNPDFTQLGTPVCEYRVRLDGSNSVQYCTNASSAVVSAQQRAQQLIKDRKKHLVCYATASDLADYRQMLDERDQLPFKIARAFSPYYSGMINKIRLPFNRYVWLRKRLGRILLIIFGQKVHGAIKGTLPKN